MDSKKQKQKRRWGRNRNKKHNLPTSKRRQHSRRTPRPGKQVDNTRNQTKKHSNRSLLRTPRKRKNRESNRNIQKPGNPNPTETEETRNHTRRRLQRKVKDRPTNDTTKRIKKRRDTRKTTPQNKTHPHKHQRRPWKMDQGKQKETRRKINHRLHSHIKRDRETISNYSGWRGTVQSQGENETDHNTIITTVTTNLPRKKTYIEKWNLANEEGWDKFNKEMNRMREELSNKEYPQLESEIRETMAKTIGKKKIRTDKEPKPNSKKIKVAKDNRKIKKAAFHKATKENNPKRKQETLQEYLKSQKNMRATIEEYENRKTEERIKQITNKAKINPNTIWETKKRTRTDNNLAYETITEEGTSLTDPQKTKEHIADYFEDLYQARPGTPVYETWTNHIEKTVEKAIQAADQQEKKIENITYKELNKVIKKLKRKKSLGPDKIPNETFIEPNKDTREIFRSALNRIHEKEEIPESWQLGHILRLYKGKGIKGKCSNERGITLASNPGKLYERIINERVKKQVQLTEAQAEGIAWSATCHHLTILDQTIQEIREEKKTAYIIFLDVQKAYDKAWLNGILYALNQNGVSGKNLIMIKKINTNLKSQNPYQRRPHQRDQNQRQHKTRRGPISDRIRHTNRWNSQRT